MVCECNPALAGTSRGQPFRLEKSAPLHGTGFVHQPNLINCVALAASSWPAATASALKKGRKARAGARDVLTSRTLPPAAWLSLRTLGAAVSNLWASSRHGRFCEGLSTSERGSRSRTIIGWAAHREARSPRAWPSPFSATARRALLQRGRACFSLDSFCGDGRAGR